MKLTYPDWEKQLEWKNGRFPLVILEAPDYHFQIVEELYKAADGEDTEFVLSEGERLLELSRAMEVVPSPWAMDWGSRKLMTALYGRLKKELASAEFLASAQEAAAAAARYAEAAEDCFPFSLRYDEGGDPMALLKAIHLRPEMAEGSLAERMLSYMALCEELLGTACFVFCGFRGFLSEETLRGLYQTAFLKKFHFLLIENTCQSIVKEEDRFIMDKDLCQIF